MAKLTIEISEGNYNTKPVETYRDIYNIWIVDYKTTVKESTYNKTLGYFKNHLLPAFGDMKLDKITGMYCQQVTNDLFTKLTRYHSVINYAEMVFKYAVKHELLKRNPIELVTFPRPKVDPTQEPIKKFYDREELQHFLNALDQEDQKNGNYLSDNFFRVLALTGMRRGEALALTWNDIDFDNKVISINKGVTLGVNNKQYIETPKTVNSARTINIDDRLTNYLKCWQIEQRREQFKFGFNVANNTNQQLVFASQQNKMISVSRPRTWLIKIIKKYQLPYISVHKLRHTHASLLFEAGASIKQVQERLGHSDVKTTMDIYAHVSKDSKLDTVKKFDKFLEM